MPAHVLQRGQNRAPVFCAAQDSLESLKIVKQGSDACPCALHASVLMTNTVAGGRGAMVCPQSADFSWLADNVPVVITELFEALLGGRHESKRTHWGI